MDLKSNEFSGGFELNNNNNFNENKLKLLESKILIYQKENQSLKNKIKILQEDNDDKNLKIQEQLNHLLNLENDNNSLKKLYDNSKQKFNNESNSFINAKKAQDKEINNMKMIIGELKSENERLSKSLIIQNKENNKLQQNLMKTVSENKIYSKDNSILLSKVKEYEENICLLGNNENDNNKILNLNGQKKNEYINNVNSIYENKLALYSSIINDEINIIAKYIDTYLNLNLNLTDDIKLEIPLLQNITNFPKDNKLSSFWNIINAVENALKRIINQNKIIKNNEMLSKQEINKLNNILEKKNNENLELKKTVSDLKKNLFYLKNDYDKINSEFISQKGFNKQIQETMKDINNGNDEYLKGLYKTLKNEVDNIINEPLFHSYINIMLEQKNNIKSEYNTGLKYLIGEILDKYILINNCIIDDFKKIKSQKLNNKDLITNNYEKNSANIQRLETVIDELNNRLMEKDRIISNDKDEKKLLINQINILQRDIYNLKNSEINNQNDDNIINENININNNKYMQKSQNINNINDNYQNHSDIYKSPLDMNYNNNYNNYNDYNNMHEINNEEMKDNQTQDVEENEIYFEGQQFPNPEGFSDMNNYNMSSSDNNQNNNNNNQYKNIYNNMNNEQNEPNEEEIYNEEEQENNDFNNNMYQFQEIIEEEENENNTVEDSNKNKSIKNSNIHSNKSNFNNNINIDNNNNLNFDNNFRMAKSQIDQMKNININDMGEGLDENLINKNISSKK